MNRPLAVSALDAPAMDAARRPGADAAPRRDDDRPARRGRLLRRYLGLILALVCGALLVSGAITIYFAQEDNKAASADLQREKAVNAAYRIQQYVDSIDKQLRFAALLQINPTDVELRRIEFLKLLRQTPEITDIAQLDASGRELLAVSPLGRDEIGSMKDRSGDAAFRGARRERTWFGPVTFRKDTEPYVTLAVRSGGAIDRVTIADVSLRFIGDVVSSIRIGERGKAYVVDQGGFLIADPDPALVLRKTNLSDVPHVRYALKAERRETAATVPEDETDRSLLASFTTIEPLGWTVLVEQPLSEVYAHAYASLVRTGLLLLGGLVVSSFVALAFARGMVRPIRTLSEGAQRIAAGDLDQAITVRTGDELEGLADEFNRMSGRLRESYASLERKVTERTHELRNALDQQTAISEILRVISESPTEVQPVLDAVARRAAELCEAPFARVMLLGEDAGSLVVGATYSVPGADAQPSSPPVAVRRTSLSGRALLDQRAVHVPDVVPLLDSEFPDARPNVERAGIRAVLAVPLVRGGNAYGVIVTHRREPGAFLPDQIALVETFARQAAIAIDNVRLFNETKDALEQQRASAEVLTTISNSISETGPVFDAILRSCERLFSGHVCALMLVHGETLEVGAYHGPRGDTLARLHPAPLSRDSASGRSILDQVVTAVPDLDAADAPSRARMAGTEIGFESIAAAPMMFEGHSIGALWVARSSKGPFDDKLLALLKTFADQAVIAIQNARLVGEIREKSRELEIANQHKSEFLANMSHELRTPLNAIIGFSEVLLERLFGDVNAKQADYLDDIHSSGRHLLELINDILDLSKIEAGRMELEPSTFDLPGVLANALTLVRERAQRDGIALDLDVDPALGPVTADARKVKQILVNLLSNAVKFTPNGGRIDVTARRVGERAVIAVRDTGIGIAPEDQAAVFEEFRQVGRDYASKHEGTGLGLALTRRFVELHGGTIRVDSAPGKGSTFTFDIPLSQ